MAKKSVKKTTKLTPVQKRAVQGKAPKTLKAAVSSPRVPQRKESNPKRLPPHLEAAVQRGKEKVMIEADITNNEVSVRQTTVKIVGAPHGVVRARAGTGKTFTLIMGIANMFRDEQLGGYTFRGPRGESLDSAKPSTLWGKVEREMGRWRNPLTGHWEYPATVKSIKPSPQQKEIWDFMAKEKPKTVCYAAFNNSIVDDFAEKYDWLVDALDTVGVKLTFSTLHSLGNKAVKDYYKARGWKCLHKWKVTDILSAFWEVDLREVWKEKAEQIQSIKELVSLCKATMTGTPEEGDDDMINAGDDELETLAIHYGIDITEKEAIFKAVRHILEKSRDIPRDGTGRWDFDDMCWLPVVNNLPMEKYDLLMVDEAQDLNKARQQIALKSGKRIIVVGDERQAIYGFNGADVASIDNMYTLLGGGVYKGAVAEMKLTQTRRCGKAIVRSAQRFVPDFEAFDSNHEGQVVRCRMELLELPPEEGNEGEDVSQNPYSLGEEDFVLCRTNAPLVGLAFRMLKAGKRVNIKGRDIGEGLKSFIKKSKAKDVSEFLVWLENYQQVETERISKRKWVDAEALVTLEDKCMCLRTFSDGAITIKDLYKSIDQVFKGKVCPSCQQSYDEKERTCWKCKEGQFQVKLMTPAGTMMSSIHRAKGMEAKRVFIIRPDLMPHKKAKTEWERGQEANLQYVAETRAIETLVYVDGKGKNEDA